MEHNKQTESAQQKKNREERMQQAVKAKISAKHANAPKTNTDNAQGSRQVAKTIPNQLNTQQSGMERNRTEERDKRREHERRETPTLIRQKRIQEEVERKRNDINRVTVLYCAAICSAAHGGGTVLSLLFRGREFDSTKCARRTMRGNKDAACRLDCVSECLRA